MALLPTYSYDQIAHYMTDENWTRHHFDVSPGGTLTVNLTALTVTGKALAAAGLQAWTMATGIVFSIINTPAQIDFTDDPDASPTGGGVWNGAGIITSAYVNVPVAWIDEYGSGINTYSFQIYVHEIGHALGLGHPGAYHLSAAYRTDDNDVGGNVFLNDSWQATVMSYFSPRDNTSMAENWGYSDTVLLTPMIADIVAMWDLYGVDPNLRSGDTVYGEGSTAGGYYDVELTAAKAFTIVDANGTDTIDFSLESAAQFVDLNPESISSVGGLVGNMAIMRDTIIENFFSGSGDDRVIGNIANNWVKGGAGEDVIKGGDGDDNLNGNWKHDVLKGEAGNDYLRGGGGPDQLYGGDGDDVLRGGNGRDKLTGGAGADKFVFNKGWAVDRINDFEDDIDTIRLDANLWGGALTEQQVLDAYGTVVSPIDGVIHVEFDFGSGDKLKVFGISDVNALLDDISIF